MLTSIKTNHLTNEGQKLGMMYFRVAIILFGAQLLMGLIAATQFLVPGFLFELFDFSVARMVHINALVVWMLYAMIGSTYIMLTEETGHEGVAIGLGKLGFWVLTVAVTIVVLVYIFVQYGAGTEASLWLIHEGREYIEAPRWADIGIVVVFLIF
jgi:nitric oxide reductase subunit B